MKPTYDEIQLAAVLRACTGCGRWYYLTHDRSVCVRCAARGAVEIATSCPARFTPQDGSQAIGSAERNRR